MSSDNFTPNGAFEGFVYAKLEAMTDRLNALPCDEQSKKLNECENEISNIKGKASVISAVTGFIAGFISKIFLPK